MSEFLPATPNLQRRLRLLESDAPDVDFREGAPLQIVGGIAVLAVVPGALLGFAMEANNPALVGVGAYTEPVFGPGGGKDGGPFVIDVHPGSNDGTREQCLVAIAHDSATFIMDFSVDGVTIGTPPVTAIGLEYDVGVAPDNGAGFVNGAAPGTTVRVVNIVSSDVDQSALPVAGVAGIQRYRVEVVAVTPQLNG